MSTSHAERAGRQEARLAEARESGDRAAAADLALELARLYWQIGELEQAAGRCELAIDILEGAGLQHRLGSAYVLHATLFFQRDKASQAMAAIERAIGYPDLSAVDRCRLYEVAALSLYHLVDLQTGGDVLLEKAWPQALLTGDGRTIFNTAARCAGMLHERACWAGGIATAHTLGVPPPAGLSQQACIDLAWQFIGQFEARADCAGPSERSWALLQKGAIVALERGFLAALPVFAEAESLANAPRTAMIAAMTIGRCAAIDRRWETARDYLLGARSQEASRSDQARRYIAWEMSHVEQALGRAAEALKESREFQALNAEKSRIASEWFLDAKNRGRYGRSLDIDAARKLVLGKPLPPALVKAMRFISSHLTGALAVEEVAAAAGVSKRTLQSLFKVNLGVVVSDFVREQRMQRADEELRDGRRPIAKIVEALAYSSAANFSRDYRKRFGRPPSATRREAQSRRAASLLVQ